MCNALTELCKENLPLFTHFGHFLFYHQLYLLSYMSSGTEYGLYIFYSKMNVSFAEISSWMVSGVIIVYVICFDPVYALHIFPLCYCAVFYCDVYLLTVLIP